MLRNLSLVFVELAVVATTLPLMGDDATKQPVEVTKTERVNFAPGGVIRVNGSYGDFNVEGWDQPAVEITVIRSMGYYESKKREEAVKRLDLIRVSAERRNDAELEISTVSSAHRNRLLPPFTSASNGGVKVEYEIHAPRDSKLVIHHGTGSVSVTDMTGDIEATVRRGDIVLMLPESGVYSIDAKSKMGTVIPDFPGVVTHKWYAVGERFASDKAPSGRRIYLRVGFGGITIKGIPPEALAPTLPGVK
jgi:hypothetical protein